MSPLTRVLLVTGGLILTGGVLGAIAGAAALWLAVAVTDQGWGNLWLNVLIIPAVTGATMGAVGLPLVAWTLLRRVSLGRVFALSVAGTILGGVAGWALVSGGGNEIAGGLRGAVAGFVLAAVAMWIETRFARRADLRTHGHRDV